MKGIYRLLSLLIVLAHAGANAQVVTYCCDATAEQQYLADIAGLGTTVTESFEAAPWDTVRWPSSLASITNQGLIWSRQGGGIITTPGDSHDGNYEVYAVGPDGVRHPVPDGFDVQGDGITFNAFGGWYSGNNTKIRFIVDNDPGRVDFSGTDATLPNSWKFLGFIDTTPFTKVEIREADETGDETKIFWADDFTFSMSGVAPSPGQLQFANAVYSVDENGASVQVTVTRTGGSDGEVDVDYATTDGSATAGSDYTATSGTLNFSAAQVSRTITIPVLDDVVYEGDEMFTVGLSNPGGGATLGTPVTTTVTITEDDTPPSAGTLQFSGADFGVTENAGPAVITVTRTGGSDGAVSVDYATSDGSASAGNDYTVASGTLNFADGQLNDTFNVAILDDQDYEGDETLTLSLSNAMNGATLGNPVNATLTINENDPVPPAGSLQFSAATYMVGESGPVLTATVTRTGGSFGEVTVDYATADNSATAGSDYTDTSGTLTFADGELTMTFNVPITDDSNYEGDETFVLNLSSVTGGAFAGAPMSANVTITENDPVPAAGSLQFSGPSYPVNEGGTEILVTVTRTGGSSGAVTVDFATSNGSAAAGSDYAATSGMLSFADSVTSRTFSVSIIDDAVYEGNESFTVSLSNATNGASLGNPAVATVTIQENDPPPSAGSLQFSGASYSVPEDGGSTLVTVTRTGGSAGAVVVNYASADGSATAGSDYAASSGTLSFANGEISRSFSVTVLDDQDYEGDETVSLSLSGPTNGAVLGNPSDATLTITENDSPPSAGSLQFSGAAYSVGEAAGDATVTVTRTGGSAGTVSADYATSNGTATAGADYTASSGTLTFANGVLSQSVTISITDDMSFEGDEMFSVTLSNPSVGSSLGTPTTANVTISENDAAPQPPNPAPASGGGGGMVSPIALVLMLCLALFMPPQLSAAETGAADPHANHKKMMSKSSHRRTVHDYDLGEIGVTLSDSVETTLSELVADDKPVMVHFIFTTCTTICPVQAATFSQVQRKLGDEASEVQMVSVSIDPEYDTPARLQEYAKKFQAGSQWQFITGTSEQMIQVQRAFDAYEGNKMNHRALTLIKIPGSDDWVRLEGLIGASVIIEEYRKLKSAS